MTQSEEILSHLKAGRTITAIQALNKFNCFRLAARVNDLRKDGHDISTDYVVRNKKRIARYCLQA